MSEHGHPRRSVEMAAEPEVDPRFEPPARGDECTTLVGFLRWQR